MKSLFSALVGAFMIAGFAAPSAARDLESMRLASDLGDVLGSEEACGLSFDPAAIEAFIDEHVRADDMSFTGSLNSHSRGAARDVEQMTESGRTAHCRQIRRVAITFGFIEE